MFSFHIKKKLNKARLSELTTPHGKIPGPFFQFVATQGAIRGQVMSEDMEALGADIMLANTYHLHLRPGEDVIQQAGNLHGFMQWDKPLTTDSGGYQVFSLGKHVKIDSDGVTFQSPLDGNSHRFTPEITMQIQAKLGPDIVMPLDVCTPFSASKEDVEKAINLSTAWAKRCIEEQIRLQSPQCLYGIIQGGVYPELREQAAQKLRNIGFFGYSIGGELQEKGKKEIKKIVAITVAQIPEDAPRYLMGYGKPEDIVEAVRLGIDQFDCVLPIRNARHGQVFSKLHTEELARCLQNPDYPIDPKKLYTVIDITKSAFANDETVFAPNNPVITKPYTHSYVHHLMRAEAPSGMRLAVLANIHFYVELMKSIREIIAEKGV
ncbi:MAG: tRNA guanosine(34) transglycosylase Tgt [bacterium]|nr:tRNA guanosine(34) transglycosylase Tgt [bacterium]